MAAFELPELYKESSDITYIGARYMLNKYKYLINWKEDASIFEFGVGDGSHSSQLLWPLFPGNYKEFIGTDLSKTMVDFAKNYQSALRGEICKFDITCENIPHDYLSRFDNILSIYTMMLVGNPEQAFKNIFTMLKSNGQTFNIFPLTLPTDDMYKKLSNHAKWGKYDHQIMITPYSSQSHPEKCYEKALLDAGFRNCHYKVKNFSYSFKNEKEWKDFMLSVNAVVGSIPTEEIEEYKEYFFKQIDKEVLLEDDINIDSKGRKCRLVKLKLSVFEATKTSD